MADYYLLGLLTLDATLRLATPLILAALAGLFAERSGVIDIGLEGKMLASAFASACVAALTGSAWLGLLGGIGISILLALLHGVACITYRGNQVISGVAINILVAGLTVTFGMAWYGRGGQTPQLPNEARFTALHWPGVDALSDIPYLGAFYAELVSGHNVLVYLALLAVPISWWVIYRTRFGLRLRAVGENPAAVDTAGISVVGLRYAAMLCCGLLCGISGSYLAIAANAGFIPDMTAGKGFIALAAMIFGQWRPFPALFACLLFGFLDAAAARLQGVTIPLIEATIPVQLIQALPYILTVVLLAGFIGRAVAPKADGIPYVKER